MVIRDNLIEQFPTSIQVRVPVYLILKEFDPSQTLFDFAVHEIPFIEDKDGRLKKIKSLDDLIDFKGEFYYSASQIRSVAIKMLNFK